MEQHAALEACVSELNESTKTLLAGWRQQGGGGGGLGDADGSTDFYAFPPADSPDSIAQAQQSVFSQTGRIRAMVGQPIDFLRALALHTQLLACLQWLCEFQVLACIPLDTPVPVKDVADISGVPEAQLYRVVGMMATAGFLRRPRPGHIAHSTLSAQFVTQPALVDAALFLSETAAPAALKMPSATRQFAGSDRPDQSAYTAAFDTSVPLANVCELRPKLQRQFATYLNYISMDDEVGMQNVLMCLDWQALGSATVVDVGAQSAATGTALTGLFPSIHWVVQTYENGPIQSTVNAKPRPSPLLHTTSHHHHHSYSRGVNYHNHHHHHLSSPTISGISLGGAEVIGPLGLADISPDLSGGSSVTMQTRSVGNPQQVPDAEIYILHVLSPNPSLSWATIASHTAAELRAHVDVLRANPGSRLVLTALVLPDDGYYHHPSPSSSSTSLSSSLSASSISSSSASSVSPEAEAAARLRDLSLMQLANGRHVSKAEVVDLIYGVRDAVGALALTNEISSPTSPFLALEVRYQSYLDGEA